VLLSFDINRPHRKFFNTPWRAMRGVSNTYGSISPAFNIMVSSALGWSVEILPFMPAALLATPAKRLHSWDCFPRLIVWPTQCFTQR